MDTVVIEHVPVSDLPVAWRARLSKAAFAPSSEVTVRLEQETAEPQRELPLDITANPLFGMWCDRTDLADVAAYVQQLRQPRFGSDGFPRPA